MRRVLTVLLTGGKMAGSGGGREQVGPDTTVHDLVPMDLVPVQGQISLVLLPFALFLPVTCLQWRVLRLGSPDLANEYARFPVRV